MSARIPIFYAQTVEAKQAAIRALYACGYTRGTSDVEEGVKRYNSDEDMVYVTIDRADDSIRFARKTYDYVLVNSAAHMAHYLRVNGLTRTPKP